MVRFLFEYDQLEPIKVFKFDFVLFEMTSCSNTVKRRDKTHSKQFSDKFCLVATYSAAGFTYCHKNCDAIWLTTTIFIFSDPAEQVYAIKCTQLCHCSAGSATPQDLVLRGLIPRRVLFCGVWYPAEFCSVGYQTPQNQTKKFWELAILFMLKEPPI